MPAEIKAIVFKTKQLKATRAFFEHLLRLPIKESSALHFVLYSKNIRLVFVESTNDLEVEIYVNDKSNHLSAAIPVETTDALFSRYIDPNGIRVIIADKNLIVKK